MVRDCGGGVFGGQVGVDRGCRGDAGGGGLHDAGGYVGEVACDPDAVGCGAAGGVRRDLVADAERVLGDGDAEVVQERVAGLAGERVHLRARGTTPS